MKKTVHYKPHGDQHIAVGGDAFVLPTDHPGPGVSNTTWIRTTRVLRREDDGTFETQNTIYVPL